MLLPFFASAQTESSAEVKKKINSIKMDPAYLKAEANDSVQELAFRTASNELLLSVKSRYEGQGIEALSAKMLQPALKTLVYSRGAVKRVFVFLEISLVDSVAKSLGGVPPTLETTLVEAPVIEVPPIEPSASETPPIEPATEAPIASVNQIASNELILLLCNVEMADEAAKLLQQFKKEGKIKEIGQMKPGTDIPAGSILVVYSREKQLQALLSQEGDTYHNIKRDCPDQLSNYSGCGVLWFR